MKVVHVISGLKAGGAEHFVLELCNESLTHNDDVSVLSLSGADELLEKFSQAGIKTIVASPGKRARAMKGFAGFRKLLRVKNGVLHAHMFHACVVACAVKVLRPKCKVVFTLHNNYVPQIHRRLLLFVTRPLRTADVVFPGLRRRWYQKRKTENIPVAINVRRFEHLVSNKPPLFTIAFIGRLSEEKNPLALIAVAKKLLERHQFVIRVAGDGPLMGELKQQVEKENLDKQFVIHGYVSDVAKLLSESHCVVIPSQWEGMPLALLEAGATGVPVVATPVGNIALLLTNDHGYVATLDQFPRVIETVMDNYGTALIRARNLMHKVYEEFSIEACYQKHVTVYSQA